MPLLRSLTRKRRGVTVAPSPFNGIKFELGVILLLLPLGWLVVARLVTDTVTQLMLLFGMASVASLWLLWRTRTVLRRLERERQDGSRQG